MSTVQRSCYSGHRRFHFLVYRTITIHEGLIFHVPGPVEGGRTGAYLYRAFKIYEHLSSQLHIEGHQYYLYSDRAYVFHPWMKSAYRYPPSTKAHAAFNKSMNTVRPSVKWKYKVLKQQLTSHDFYMVLKVGSSPVSVMYIPSALVPNFKTCIYQGEQGSNFFHCTLSTQEEYIRMKPESLKQNF